MIYKEMSTLESGGILQGSYLLCYFYIIYYYSLMDLEIPVFSNLQINDVVFTVVIFTPGFTPDFYFPTCFCRNEIWNRTLFFWYSISFLRNWVPKLLNPFCTIFIQSFSLKQYSPDIKGKKIRHGFLVK